MNAGETPLPGAATNFARDRVTATGLRRLRLRGRLNLFQAAMLRWRDLHPYNAVHVVRIAQPFDRTRAESAIAQRLAAAGLTGLVLDRARRRYEYRGGPPSFELDVIAAGPDGDATLKREIESQLNRPFQPDNALTPRPPCTDVIGEALESGSRRSRADTPFGLHSLRSAGALTPFRFFVRDDGGEFRLGLAYDHFVAGGDSIAVLLTDIVCAYLGAPNDNPTPDLYPPTFRPLFTRNAASLLRHVSALSRVVANCRRSVRPRYRDHADGANGFDFVTLPAPAAVALRDKARALGVTFNDLLIGVILKAMANELQAKRHDSRRREIAVASIVNLRRECGVGDRDAFGQFLSSMRVSHAVPDGVSAENLALDVHRETARFKKDRLYLQMLLAMRVNGVVWWFLDADRRRRLYSKAYPVMAGLTSLNVDALWRPAGVAGESRDYLRAVPTGPLAPLVVAATTSGDALALGFSYRRSAFAPADIVRIGTFIAESIRALR